MAHHITKTISNKAFWIVNKELCKHLGLHTTLLLQQFVDLQTNVFGGKEFYQSHDQLTKELPLSYHYIREGVTALKSLGIITVTKKGMPAKNHYFVLLDKIQEVISLDSSIPQVKLEKDIISTRLDNIASQVEQSSPNKTGPSHLTKKRKLKKELNKKEIIIKEAIADEASTGEKNILQRYLDELTNNDFDEKKFKIAMEDVIEYGGLQKVYKKLEFDDSVISNYNRAISNIKQFINA